MANYQKVVEMLGENLASFLELAKKLLIDWKVDPKRLLHILQNIRKEDLVGLIEGTHSIMPKIEEDFLNDLGIYSISGYSEIKNLGDHKKDFKSFFDSDYKKWKLAQSQEALKAGNLDIKEMKPGKNGNYSKIFNAFGRPLDEMAVTENRINQILFSEDAESKKIREVLDLKNFWTHFLVKKDNEFFVVDVNLTSGGLNLHVNRFDDANVWNGAYRNRFVAAV
jgi:hypothetical protein